MNLEQANLTYGNGDFKEPVYDDEDRIIGEKFGVATNPSTEKFKYAYNAEGNLGYHEDRVNGINYKYIYDLSGRLGKVVGSDGNSVKYDYDKDNNISNVTEKIKDKTYSTDYTYDKDSKQKTITYDGNNIDFDYDALGRLNTKTINKGTTSFATNYAYEAGVETNSTTTRVSTITNNGSPITYTYDANGNIETITENGKQIKYYYNELNELIREDNEVLGNTITYTYDGGGNISSRTKVRPSYDKPSYPLNNLYVDGSFELGINEIESRYGTGSTLITDTSNAGIAIAGDKYFYMQGYSGDNYAYINQSMQVTPGKTYKISFYHKEATTGTFTSDSSYMYLSDGSYEYFNTSLVGDQQWRKMEKTWTCPAGITSIQLRFGFRADDYSWLAVDDVQITDMNVNDLYVDGSFEYGSNYIESSYGATTTTITDTSNAGTAKTGDKYFYMDGDTADNYAYINRHIQVTPGKTYSISFYQKEYTQGTLTGDSSYIKLSDGSHVSFDTTLIGDSQWRKMDKMWTCPEGITSIQLRFGFGADDYSWLAVDDIRVQDMGDNNLNSDGSFELGINYIDSRYGIGATRITDTSNAGTARTGDKYFYMDGDEGDNYAYINRPIQVTPGKTYNISFYHKEATTGTFISNSSYMRVSDGNHVYLDTTLVGDQEWHRMEKTWTCPEGITSIQLRFGFGTDDYSWLAVDDVEIIENNTYEPIETIEYSYDDSSWKDKLTSFNGKDITYDDIGNPLTYDDMEFSWEHGRQLKSMKKGVVELSFKYNSSGIRTEKTVGSVTTKYHLEGDKVTFETNGTDEIHYSYSSSGRLVSMNLNGTEYYYIRNAQGDITGLFDESGIQVVKYNYYSWGKLTPSQDELDDATDTDKNGITGSLKDSIGVKNSYGYRGYRYDSETELYYLQSRYYNPEWSRFINVDALGGRVGELLSHNIFMYSKNNSVNMSDPSGFRPIYSTTLVEETDAMREASFATMRSAAQQQTVMYAKGGKSRPNSKFRGMSDDEINEGANNKSIPKVERREYQTEQKFRGLRDVNKRKELYGGGNKSGRNKDSMSETVTTGVKWGVVIYFVISEGTRIFPLRNLIPIP